jgi:tripartite ATP-independent transporter DctP family solute receptor
MLILSMTLFSLAGCGNSAAPGGETPAPSTEAPDYDALKAGPVLNLSIGYASAEGTAGDRIIRENIAKLEIDSNNKFKFEIYPAAQLGGDREMAESVQLGDQDILMGAPSPLISFVPELAILDMPMAFSGYTFDQIDKVTKGEVGDFKEKISAAYEKAGFKLLTLYSTRQFRVMSSNKLINNIEDLKGIRIRTMENKYHMNFWNALGASATPVNFAELYLALQQGVVDAQENPIAVLVLNGFAEQQKYSIETNHILFFVNMIMNLDTWNSLTPAQQVMLQEMINNAADQTAAIGEKDNDEFKAKAVEQGVEIIVPNAELLAAMKEKTQSTVDMIKTDVGQDLVDSLLNSLEQSK